VANRDVKGWQTPDDERARRYDVDGVKLRSTSPT